MLCLSPIHIYVVNTIHWHLKMFIEYISKILTEWKSNTERKTKEKYKRYVGGKI